MATTSNGQQQAASEDEEEQDLPTAHLTRPSPDAILADEADENALLGNESESETSNSRRNSTLLPVKDDVVKPIVPQMVTTTSETPTQKQVDSTPTQSTFASKRSSLRAPLAYKTGPNEADLKAQIADLTNQVTGLNSKLVSSFMRISDLEDDLSDKHEQLKKRSTHVASLEKEREEHLAALNTGLLVEKAHVSSEMQKMMERVIEETAQRGKAISDKEKIEAELDELSSNLFSEANKMVANERLARARAEEKSRSMEERLKDTEEIMEQQQKRLVELQGVVEKGNAARLTSEADSKSGTGGSDGQADLVKAPLGTSILPVGEEPIRLDIVPYTELRAFLNHLRKLRLQLAPFYNYPLAGVASNTTTSTLPSPNESRPNSPPPYQLRVVSPGQQTSTTLSPFAIAGVQRHKDFPTLPANVDQLIHLPSQISSISFLKRVNEEDCEPCLRLDHAPGLNWLSRRQLQTSILEGNLLIEPVFGGGVYDEEEVRNRSMGSPPAACAMCGKAVLNVPLPGGAREGEGGNWITAASNAASTLQATVTSSLPSREQTSSPPLSSAVFHGASGSSTNQGANLLQKKSSTGLFSTLRSMGGSPRPSMSPNTSSTNIAVIAQAEGVPVGVEEDLFANRQLPIPTHIFRIGESSSSRYLLCPHYCLQRLRVICEFWGYIRHLERAVVLEGKLAWDEDLAGKNGTASEKTSPPPNLPERKDSASIKEVKADEVKDDEEKKESDDEDTKAEEEQHPETEVEQKDEAGENETILNESSIVSHDGSTTDEEDGFADAQSIASAPEDSQETDTPTEEAPSAPEKEDMETDQENKVKLPPLPPRSKVRRPVPSRPPALPPRRSYLGSNSGANAGPEPRRLLPSKGDTNLTWEEKVWLEVLRLRADMWSAKVGLQKQTG